MASVILDHRFFPHNFYTIQSFSLYVFRFYFISYIFLHPKSRYLMYSMPTRHQHENCTCWIKTKIKNLLFFVHILLFPIHYTQHSIKMSMICIKCALNILTYNFDFAVVQAFRAIARNCIHSLFHVALKKTFYKRINKIILTSFVSRIFVLLSWFNKTIS